MHGRIMIKKFKQMKTNFKFLSLLLCAAVAFVGCTEDLASEATPGANVASTLNVTVNTITRVALEDADTAITFDWEVGDAIAIFDSSEAYVGEFTCSNVDGTFTSSVELTDETEYIAVYPAVTDYSKHGNITDLQQTQNSSMAHIEDAISLTGSFTYDADGGNTVNFAHDFALMKVSFEVEEVKDLSCIQFNNGDVGKYYIWFWYADLDDVNDGDTIVSYIMIDACEAIDRTLSYNIHYDGSEVIERIYKVNTSKAYKAGVCYTAPVTELSVYAPASVTINTASAAYCATRDAGFQLDYTVNSASTLGTEVTWESDDEAIATVDAKGYVTIVGGYGNGKINAVSDGTVVATHTFTVPGGWWIESYDTYYSAVSSYLFGVNSNTNTTTDQGYLTATTTSAQTYSKTGITIDGVDHETLDNCWRADIWCYDESTCVLNANTYPYLVFHLDDNTVKNNVIYQEFELNFTLGTVDGTAESVKIQKINTETNYGNDTDTRVSVKYLSDGSMMLIYDMSLFNKSSVSTGLTEDPDSYLESPSMSVNYFMYGYDNDTVINEVTYPAMTTFSYNIYSIQTFATDSDIEAYIVAEGLSEIDPNKAVVLTPEEDLDLSGYLEDATTTITASTSDGAGATITWESSDELIATVSNGVVSFCGTGDVTITASADGYESASHTFNVTGLSYIDGVAQINNDTALLKFIADFNAGESMPSHDMLLTDDITATSTATTAYRLQPTSGSSYFAGVIDGGGHTISNIQVSTTWNYQGLIGRSGDGAVIKNLTIANSTIKGGQATGAFIGQADADFVVYNCHLKNSSVTGSSNRVGGIVGNGATTTISNDTASIVIGCSVDAYCSVQGTNNVGGIGGLAPLMIGCSNAGSVTSTDSTGNIGGILGNSSAEKSSVVIGCYNTGTIYVTNSSGSSYIGGVVGNGSKNGFIVDGCYSTGAFSLVADGTYTYVGGIAGDAYYGINTPNIWVDYDTSVLPELGANSWKYSTNTYPGTIVYSEADAHSATYATNLNTRITTTESGSIATGKNWSALKEFTGYYSYEYNTTSSKMELVAADGAAEAIETAIDNMRAIILQ